MTSPLPDWLDYMDSTANIDIENALLARSRNIRKSLSVPENIAVLLPGVEELPTLRGGLGPWSFVYKGVTLMPLYLSAITIDSEETVRRSLCNWAYTALGNAGLLETRPVTNIAPSAICLNDIMDTLIGASHG